MKPSVAGVIVLVLGQVGFAATINEPGFTDAQLGFVRPGGVPFGGLTADDAGNVYASGSSSVIYRKTPMGSFAPYVTLPGSFAHGMVASGTTLYAGNSAGTLYSFDTTSPSPPAVTLGTTSGELLDIVVGCAGRDLICSTQNGLYSFDLGTMSFSTMLTGQGQLSSCGCALGGNSVLVTRYSNLEIIDVTPPSTTVSHWRPTNGGPDGIAVHAGTGFMYVACSPTDSIQKIDPAGSMISTFATGCDFDGGWYPTPISFSADGTKLYYGAFGGGGYEVRVIDGFPSIVTTEVRTVDATPPIVYQGGAGYVIIVDVENTSTSLVNVTSLGFSFVGSADRTAEYLVTPIPGNPTSIAAGATAIFNFAVDVNAMATLETITIDAAFEGTEAMTGLPVRDPAADTTDTWDVQVGAAVSVLTVDAAPASVFQGSAGNAVTITAMNAGVRAANVNSVDLSFTGTADRTSEYMIAAAPGNPTSIAAGATVTFDFLVDLDVAATVETVTIDAAFDGTDAVSGVAVLDPGADVTDSWDVQAGATIAIRTVDTPITIVSQGGAGYPVSVSVEHIGVRSVLVGAIALTFTGTADRSAEYSVVADPGNPVLLAPGLTETFEFTVDVDAMATMEIITIDAVAQGTDTVTGAILVDPDADVVDSWDVQQCGATLCGDCSGDGMLSILDALTAAQHASGLITLVGVDFTNCNVTGALEPSPAAAVSILDALSIAQAVAGLPVTLVCC